MIMKNRYDFAKISYKQYIMKRTNYIILKKINKLKELRINYVILDNIDVIKKQYEDNRYKEQYLKYKINNILNKVREKI